MSAKEREVTAYHEAGHAVVGELLENSDPVHKVTILPRGRTLGTTWYVPDEEKYTESKSELLDDITRLLGGLVAEEIVFGERWTGASNDLERVTRIARAMVCQFGMSEKLGTLAIGRRSHNPFLGRDYNEDRNYSEEVAKQIDEEVRTIVDACHEKATAILNQHRDKLDRLVVALMERETLNREDFLLVMENKELPPQDISGTGTPTPTSEQEKSEERPLPRLEPGTALGKERTEPLS
jgi:cell division protease FtsH